MGVGTIAKAFRSTALPVPLLEFSNALVNSTWKRRSGSNGIANTFGLAISGGVDSMALASLCSRLTQHATSGPAAWPLDLKFRAFIVDHGVRKGSGVEAIAVLTLLQSLGIPTEVLKIDWENYGQPSRLSNFESLARKLRFQTLGKACKEFGINSLLLAHHQDDQAETIMMRMTRGSQMFGLLGMKSESEIPECRGLYGVHESGGLSDTWRAQYPEASPSQVGSHVENPIPLKGVHRSHLLTENGGITIHRPLLDFSKDRLIATCEAEKMNWFEDSTNQDPRVTVRNAIRYMYRSHQMPAALEKGALIDLSRKAQLKLARLDGIVDKVLGNRWAWTFEARTGTLQMRFPDFKKVNLPQEVEQDRMIVASILLKRVLMLVTPEENVRLSSLHASVQHLFPELYHPDSERTSKPAGFTAGGLQFYPLPPNPWEPLRKTEWFISRQPYTSLAAPTIYFPASEAPSDISSWQLYDGRFWIRVQNRGPFPILIRPLRKEELIHLKISLKPNRLRKMERLLKILAPRNVRYTLPVIVEQQEDGKEKALALPTLDFCLPNIRTQLDWEVRYKKTRDL